MALDPDRLAIRRVFGKGNDLAIHLIQLAFSTACILSRAATIMETPKRMLFLIINESIICTGRHEARAIGLCLAA